MRKFISTGVIAIMMTAGGISAGVASVNAYESRRAVTVTSADVLPVVYSKAGGKNKKLNPHRAKCRCLR